MKKKIVVLFLCATFVVGNIITVCAAIDESGKSINGYVYLYGLINSSGYGMTSVKANPDNAYLTLTAEYQDVSGVSLANMKHTSQRGDVALPVDDVIYNFPSGVKHEYASHGVQGGTTYSAAVVYTYTSIGY